MSRFQLGGAVAVCIAALVIGSVGTTVAGASAQGDAAPGATAAKKKKKLKKCRKGYKRVTIKVKRKRGGRIVTVKVKKCRKAKKAKPVVLPVPVPKPVPVPVPGPTPAPATPRITQILGWSTIGQDPDTPPADLVADGGTITNCSVTNSLSVYVRRTGFTSVGLVSHVWKRDGAIVASGTNGSTYEGAFRYALTISPVNGTYEITWSSGGTTLGTAKVTRSC